MNEEFQRKVNMEDLIKHPAVQTGKWYKEKIYNHFRSVGDDGSGFTPWSYVDVCTPYSAKYNIDDWYEFLDKTFEPVGIAGIGHMSPSEFARSLVRENDNGVFEAYARWGFNQHLIPIANGFGCLDVDWEFWDREDLEKLLKLEPT